MTVDHLLVGRADVPRVVDALAGAARVAVDTEFHPEGRYVPRLLLVQVRPDGGPTFVLDPIGGDTLQRVADALRAVPTWVVHGGAQDIRLLDRALGGVADTVLDTQIAAGLTSAAFPVGLDALAASELGETVDKTVRMADWAVRPLPTEQIAYAAADVAWLLPLWDALSAAVEARGRGDALRAACAEARVAARDPDAFRVDWRYVARGAPLSVAQARVLRALVDWREGLAQRRDRPVHHVLGDGMLRHLAKVGPRTVDDLLRHRRLSDRTIHKHGEEIVAAVRAGEASDDPILHVGRGTAAARRLAWLELWAELWGAANACGARLVLPTNRLHDLAASGTAGPPDASAALDGWRADLVGDALDAALSGRVALSLVDEDVSVARPDRERGKAEGI